MWKAWPIVLKWSTHPATLDLPPVLLNWSSSLKAPDRPMNHSRQHLGLLFEVASTIIRPRGNTAVLSGTKNWEARPILTDGPNSYNGALHWPTSWNYKVPYIGGLLMENESSLLPSALTDQYIEPPGFAGDPSLPANPTDPSLSDRASLREGAAIFQRKRGGRQVAAQGWWLSTDGQAQ